jgi:mannose-6-phosphate isomerase-like protein (cupin superfamily)
VIVTDITNLGRAAASTGAVIQWCCLARRGMLHSECEAVDYLELSPRATVTMDGRSGTEEAWYVLEGHAEFGDPTIGRLQRVDAGHLALRPADTSPIVRNASSDTPLRLLLVVVLPQAVSDRLPPRSPVADRGLRS